MDSKPTAKRTITWTTYARHSCQSCGYVSLDRASLNYHEPREEQMAQLHKGCRRVIDALGCARCGDKAVFTETLDEDHEEPLG